MQVVYLVKAERVLTAVNCPDRWQNCHGLCTLRLRDRIESLDYVSKRSLKHNSLWNCGPSVRMFNVGIVTTQEAAEASRRAEEEE